MNKAYLVRKLIPLWKKEMNGWNKVKIVKIKFKTL